LCGSCDEIKIVGSCPKHGLVKTASIAIGSFRWYGFVMPKKNDLAALRNMIYEAHDILRTTILPDGRSERAYELLTAAIHLSDELLENSPAATLGRKGGKETAKRGPDYFRKIAAMRKENKGG
jgi:hypothetical protein